MENLKGKTAFITGGASGIGLGIAKAFAKEGMNIVIADMRQDAIDETLKLFAENGWPAFGVQLDVSDRVAYTKAADAAEAKFGNIHLLINNAGIGCAGGPLWNVSHKDTDIAVRINLIAVLNGVQEIVPRMIKHGEGGHIVSTASKAALIPVPGCGLYNVTKSAVAAIMETLAEDLAGTNIGASAFCPGGYQSNLGASSNEVTARILGEEPAPPPAPPKDGGGMDMSGWMEVIRSADDAGARVVRGVKRGDLFILTHSEFKAGIEVKLEAIRKAIPADEPNPRYKEVFPMVVYNDIYEKQTQVPAL